jgi:hypothetical protein
MTVSDRFANERINVSVGLPMKQKKPRWQSRVLSRAEISVARECRYIVDRAQQRDARVVTLGKLVLFATETGDAWMLDPSEDLALCLATEGSPAPVQIDETEERVSVEWTHTYRMQGELMTFIDGQHGVTTAWGYPTREIGQAIRRGRA